MIYGEELGGGGISTKTIPPQGLNLTLKGGNGKIDCTFTGITSQWLYLGQYYRLIAKPGSAPTSPMDGVQVVDVQVGAIGDAVISASITGLTNGVQYFVRLYVRSENGWQTSVDAVGTATPVAGIALSTIAASDAATEQILMLPEQGIPVKFILLKHDYENSGRSLVLRKDLYDERPFDSNSYSYNGSDIDIWLNGIYLDYIDTEIRHQITPISIPSKTSTISKQVFLLSLTEFGCSNSSASIEGVAISYFGSNARRVAYLNNGRRAYWIRTSNANCFMIGSNGAYTVASCYNIMGSRPAFTLSADFLLAPEPNPDGSYSPLT
ncbi:DUF6273 domain-containing protein [Anaerotruncus rubiinfantis]|uniref:DUF6273 domain-containing protein n=1 Tax=Anaerotruncus rubiinfantis TaxID=1720200 RepID=UPI000834AF98|nr:DUF6273 domain-containing protein [Anaerotruncus rubiinfantis]